MSFKTLFVILSTFLLSTAPGSAGVFNCAQIFSNHTSEYIMVVSALGLIKNESGLVLLIKRSSNDRSYAGMWSLPGGKVDDGETIEQAIVREVKEETGLDVTVIKKTGVHESFMEGRDTKYVIHSFELRALDTSNVVLSDEHEDFRWVTPEEAALLPLAGELTEKLLGFN